MKHRLILAGVMTLASLTGIASADVIKADNTTNLNIGASWVGGVVPTAADTMIVDTTLTANRTAALGSNVSVLGVAASATNTLTINNTASSTLTIGSGGITKSGAGGLTFNSATSLGGNITTTTTGAGGITFGGPLTLTANQTWGMGSSRWSINNVITTGGNTLNISANSGSVGILDLRGATLDTNVTIGTMDRIYVQSGNNTLNGVNNTASSFFIFGGTANVASMGNLTGPSSIGKASPYVQSATTLNFTGNNETSNKGISRDGNGTTTINVTNAGQTLSMSGNFTTGSSGTTGGWAFGGAGNLTLSGVINNASNTTVTKRDAGTLTLSGTNTYVGGTIISNGVVYISAGHNLGVSTGKLTFAGGTLRVTNNFTLSQSVSNTAAGGTYYIDEQSTLTVTSVIAGVGIITKDGPGTLILNAANTYVDTTVVTGGTLLVNGTHTGGGAYTVYAGATLGGSGTIDSAVAVSSGGYLAAGGAVGTIGSLTLGSTLDLDGAVLEFDLTSDTTPGTTFDQIAVTSTLGMSGVNTIQLSAPSGSIAIGTYTLLTFATSADSTFVFPNGTTNWIIGASTINLQNGATSLQLIVSGEPASLRLKWKGPSGSTVWDTTTANWLDDTNVSTFATGDHVTFDESAETFEVTGSGSPGSVIFSNTTAYDVSAVIGGAGATVSKYGAGTVTLSGSNTFGGGVLINGGTVKYGATTNLGSSNAVTLDGGTLTYTGAPASTLSSVTVNSGNGTLLATNLSSGAYLTVNSLSGAGTLMFHNGSGQWDSGLSLAGTTNNGFSGRLIVSHAGNYGFLKLTNEAVLGTNPDALTLNASILQPISGTLTLDTHTLTITNGAAFMGNIVVNSKLTGSGGQLTIQGALTLGSTANDYTGDLRIYGNGSVLKLGADNVIPFGAGKGNILFSYGAVLDMNGKSATINALTEQYLGTSTVDIVSAGGASTLTVGDNNAVGSFSGNIRNTTGILSLTKIGSGTQILYGTNTYLGSTLVSGGKLTLGSASAVSASTSIVVQATLDVSSNAWTLGAGQVLSGTGTLVGASTVAGAVSPGSGGIGTLTASNVTWNAGVAWPYDLGDRLAINGVFSRGTGSSFTFDLQSVGGAGVYTLVTWSVSTDFVDGDFAASNVPGGLTPTFTVNANELILTLTGGGPSAGPVTLYRTSGQPLHLLASALTTNSSNPGGGAVTTSWVSVTSSNGHPVYLSGAWVFYVPPANDNTTDYFNFRIANTNGVEAESTATILISSATTNTVNVSSVSISNNTATFQWAGLPGRTNMVDGATELGPVPAANWSNIGEVVVSGIGIGSFAETNPPSPRYYRISDIVP